MGGLDFDFQDGACAATASKIYLCFRADMDFKSCQTGNDPTGIFEHIAESNFEHQYTRIAAGPSEIKHIPLNMFNFELVNILAVGSLEKHKQAELLSTTTEEWTAIEEYPYSGSDLIISLISK